MKRLITLDYLSKPSRPIDSQSRFSVLRILFVLADIIALSMVMVVINTAVEDSVTDWYVPASAGIVIGGPVALITAYFLFATRDAWRTRNAAMWMASLIIQAFAFVVLMTFILLIILVRLIHG